MPKPDEVERLAGATDLDQPAAERPVSNDLPLYEGAVSNERFVLTDLPLSNDLPLAEGEVLNERVPELKLLPGRSLPTLPDVVMELPFSRAAVFLRIFSAPLLVSAFVNRVVLDDLS